MTRLSQAQVRLLKTMTLTDPYAPQRGELEPLGTLWKRGYALQKGDRWLLTPTGAEALTALQARSEALRAVLTRSPAAMDREPVLRITVWAADSQAQDAMVRHLSKHLKETMHLETPYEVTGASA